jgi:RNA polymerase sigma-70 factor (ECF subfamily)
VGDLVQEVFLRAYIKIGQYRGEAPFLHWLLRIARNVARTHFRQQGRRRWRLWERLEEETEVPAAQTCVRETSPDLSAVHAALERLSTTLREAVVLFELEELSLKELAAALEVPLSTAASRVRRGRIKLRKILEDMGYSPEISGVVLCCKGAPR